MSSLVERHDKIYVIGAGGHGKVAVRAAQQSGMHVQALFDDDKSKKGSHLFGVPILGGLDLLQDLPALPTLVAIGDNRHRLRVANSLCHPLATVVHPAAIVDSEVKIGDGVLVLAGSVVQVDAVIGDCVVINNNATVEHDCLVAKGAHISSGASLAGGAKVGRGTLIGANATLIPQIEVGDFATIGAGSVVIANLPNQVTAVGVPARVISSIGSSKVAG